MNANNPIFQQFDAKYNKFWTDYNAISPEKARDVAIDIVTGAIRQKFDKVISETLEEMLRDENSLPAANVDNPLLPQMLSLLEDTINFTGDACRYVLVKEAIPKIPIPPEYPLYLAAECSAQESDLELFVVHQPTNIILLRFEINAALIDLVDLIGSTAPENLAQALAAKIRFPDVSQQTELEESIENFHPEWQEAYAENHEQVEQMLVNFRSYLEKLRYSLESL